VYAAPLSSGTAGRKTYREPWSSLVVDAGAARSRPDGGLIVRNAQQRSAHVIDVAVCEEHRASQDVVTIRQPRRRDDETNVARAFGRARPVFSTPRRVHRDAGDTVRKNNRGVDHEFEPDLLRLLRDDERPRSLSASGVRMPLPISVRATTPTIAPCIRFGCARVRGQAPPFRCGPVLRRAHLRRRFGQRALGELAAKPQRPHR